MDHIDGIVEAWRRERQDVDVTALGQLARLFRTAHLADAALTEPLEKHGLQPGWFDVLAALRRAGSPYELNPKELRSATMLSSGGMTKRLDRLVAEGLVERRPDPGDRRGTLVGLTARGRATIDAALETHAAGEECLLSALVPVERELLDGLLRKLLGSLSPAETMVRPPAARTADEGSNPGADRRRSRRPDPRTRPATPQRNR